MNFKEAKIFGLYISKDYADDILRLLVKYRDISASEAASRLNSHIKTAQDFLDAMASVDILEKIEVYEGKRPYYRYSLKSDKITFELDLNSLINNEAKSESLLLKIRERKNSGAKFTIARNNQAISNIAFWLGSGREKTERKLNLTNSQGLFLYNLPFPTAEFMSIEEIAKKSGVKQDSYPEIMDIINLLIEYKVIEIE